MNKSMAAQREMAPHCSQNSSHPLSLTSLALAALLCASAHAQTSPNPTPPNTDAGRLLEDAQRRQQLEQQQKAQRPQALMPASDAPAAAQDLASGGAAGAATVTVRSFRLSRNTAIDSATLSSLLADRVGKAQSLAELRAAADVVTAHYRERGYLLARAYVPVQNFQSGDVEITVLEALVQSVNVKAGAPGSTPSRVRDNVIKAYLPESGKPLHANLQRRLALLNELSGLAAQADLSPGSTVGTTQLDLRTAGGSAWAAEVGLDNFGSDSVGTARLNASLNWVSPTGVGDNASLRAMASSGIRYARVGYLRPLGTDGWKAELSASQLNYELGGTFAPLQAKGSAQDFNAGLRYAWLRTASTNTNVGLSLGRKALQNKTIAGTVSDKRVQRAAFSGDVFTSFDNSSLSLNAEWVTGRLSLSRVAGDAAADAAGPRAAGAFSKLRADGVYTLALGPQTGLVAQFSAQAAQNNLDSSEQLSLGGFQGVRGYPAGEAAGDSGHVLRLQYLVRSKLDGGGAVNWGPTLDQGSIELHNTTWAGWQGTNTRLPRHYSLSSVGIAAELQTASGLRINAALAKPVGSNKGANLSTGATANAKGLNADGKTSRTRLWVTGSWGF